LLNTSDAPADVIADALAGVHERYEHEYGAGEHIAGLVRRGISARGTQRILDAVHRLAGDRLPSLAKVLGWLQGEPVQRALTRLLGHEAVRAQIVEALVRHGAGVVGLLVEQLRAEDLETRQAAAVALGRIGDRRAVAALVRSLRDSELAVPAAGALARIGDRDAFDGLLALLGNHDPAIRQSAIAALNSIGHPDMAARIQPLLSNPDPLVRESALRIAGYFGYSDCVEQVLQCCRDESEIVRRAAIESLAFFDDARVVPSLVEALDRQQPPAVRAAAAAALARADHDVAANALIHALRDPDAWVRYVTLRSLGSTGDRGVVPAVLETLRTDPAPHVRLAAIDVIGRLGTAEAWDVLEPLARSSDSDIGGAAIVALGHLEHPEALSALEGFLRAPQPWQREAAVTAIAQRPDAPARALQWVAAADDEQGVAQAAIQGLVRIARRPGPQGAEAAQALVALTAEPVRREAAIQALSELPARRIADVARGLGDSSPDVRCASVEALGRMQHADASRALEAALDDGHPGVRVAAIRALKNLGTREPQKKLMTLARTDPDPDVRRAAMFAASRSNGQ
jgi:HEAT repeat protein